MFKLPTNPLWRNCRRCLTLLSEKPGKEMQGLSSLTSRFIRMDLRTGLKLRKQVWEVKRTSLSRRRRTFPQLSSSDSSWLGRTICRAELSDLFRLTTISVSEVKIEESPENEILRTAKHLVTILTWWQVLSRAHACNGLFCNGRSFLYWSDTKSNGL